ncbi:RidA family protein [Daejeonella sp.]|jgi:enamine deaminase RidA (YjgF/YER057c/UK114 family)|uniref:RidA family protein n=1 Tax=Daejeonella sp. TaxID=2805397 RepID=UPI0027B9149E|nr:RidA family protein [Daejeonella sp.]
MKKYSLLFLITAALLSCNPKQEDAAKKETDASADTVNIEARLKELNIELTTPKPPTANFVKTVRVGNLVYTSGHGPDRAEGGPLTGRVGDDLTLEQGQEAARLTGVSLLSSLKAEIGDLSKVKRIVKVLGMVQSTPEFKDQPKVMNAFSDMMVDIFGQKGKHARSAVGMSALPGNIAIEIEMIVEVED